MDLTPKSITRIQFDTNRRGYAPEAVDAHLAEIARAVTEQTTELTELQDRAAILEAKVQDARESEEALRLTLKAAVQAKEELLAAARADAEKIEADAEQQAAMIMDGARRQADALAAASETQALGVVNAALVEIEALGARIEELRGFVTTAEETIRLLAVENSPRLEGARNDLDHALEKARSAADDVDTLAATYVAAAADLGREADTAAVEVASVESDEPVAEVVSEAEPVAEVVSEAESDEPVAEVVSEAESDEPVAEVVSEAEPVVEPVAEAEPATESEAEPATESEERHLEVVAADAADAADAISDKVNRLLEELREVT